MEQPQVMSDVFSARDYHTSRKKLPNKREGPSLKKIDEIKK
jgi:hypothetical protein